MLYKKIFLLSFMLLFVPLHVISMESSCINSEERCEKHNTILVRHTSDDAMYCPKCGENVNSNDLQIERKTRSVNNLPTGEQNKNSDISNRKQSEDLGGFEDQKDITNTKSTNNKIVSYLLNKKVIVPTAIVLCVFVWKYKTKIKKFFDNFRLSR